MKRFNFVLYAAFTFAAFVSAMTFWTESEMWSAVAVKSLFTSDSDVDIRIKPLLDLVLWVNYQVAQLISVHPMVTARILFAANALAIVFFMMRILQRQGMDNWSIYPPLILLLCNTFWLKRGAHVRSDMMATTLVLWQFYLLDLDRRQIRPMRLFEKVLLSLAAYCLTPKSLLLVFLTFFVFIRNRRLQWWALGGLVLVFGLLLLFPSFISYQESARLFFLRSLGDDPSLPPYWSLARWEHVLRFIRENPFYLLLWIWTAYMGLAHRRLVDALERPKFDWALGSLLVLAFYPDRLPFFITALSPFWCLPLGWLLARATLPELNHVRALVVRRMALFVAAFFAFAFVYWSFVILAWHNSQQQLKYIQWINSYLPELARLEVYDPAGVLPFSKAHNWFVGPAEENHPRLLSTLAQGKVDVIISSQKMDFAAVGLSPLMSKIYWTDGLGIWIRKWELPVEGGTLVTGKHIWSEISAQFPLNEQFQLRFLDKSGSYVEIETAWFKDSESEVFRGIVAATYSDWQLYVPAVAVKAQFLPVLLQTPFPAAWPLMFGFDSEL